MKKWLVMLLALVMVLSMVALAGCGDDKKKDDKDEDGDKESVTTTVADGDTVTTIPSVNVPTQTTVVTPDVPAAATIVGTWKMGPVDFGGMIQQSVAESEMADYVEFGSYPVYEYMTFGADGTMKVFVDSAEVNNAMDGVFDDLKAGMEVYLEEQAADYDMTLSEMMEQVGYESVDAMVDEMLDAYNLEEMIGSVSQATGSYTAENGVITWTFNGVTKEGTYTLSNGTLSVTMDGETQVLTKA